MLSFWKIIFYRNFQRNLIMSNLGFFSQNVQTEVEGGGGVQMEVFFNF